MNFSIALAEAIKIVDSVPAFGFYAKIIRATDYAEKFRFEPFASYSTTLTDKSVRLGHGWQYWYNPLIPVARPFLVQATNLVHEAVHQIQRRDAGNMTFNAEYLGSKQKRFTYEVEAYAEECDFILAYLGATNTQALDPYIRSQASRLSMDYFLGKNYGFDVCYTAIKESLSF